MRRLLLCCSVAMLASATVAAPEAAPQVTPKPNESVQAAGDKAQPALQKKICRNLEVGFSHRTERVCMTAKQWEEYDRGDG